MDAMMAASVDNYDPGWPELFNELSQRLRSALGGVAIRIDHIGSTAVPGLAAKPIIDVQISVESLEGLDSFRPGIESCGFMWRSENPDLTKRYFREQPGRRRTHIHVRTHGSFSEQFALLFRDYMRSHPGRANEYAQLKRELAPLLRSDREAYVRAKGPFVWETMQMADEWARVEGWTPGPSDA